MNNKVTKLALVLLLICAVTAGILGVVNALTFEQIAYNKMMKQISAFSAVLPSESGYTEVSFDGRAFPTVDSINQSNEGTVMWSLPPSPAHRATLRWPAAWTTS